MPLPARSSRPAALAALAALSAATLALAGCKAEEATAPHLAVRNLIIAQGDGQLRQAFKPLRAPLVFRATDEDGGGVADVPITFVVEQGGGVVDSASVRTDDNGEARVRWTLGGTADQALAASAPGVAPVRASATALLPTDVVVVQGNNQTGRAGAVLPVGVVVRVLGPGNVAMDSIPVSMQIAAGGGTIAPQTVFTTATGEATVRWTMGAAGTNTAYVRVGALEPTVLTATATAP